MTLDRLIIELQKLQHKGLGSTIVTGYDAYTGQECPEIKVETSETDNSVTVVFPFR